MVDVTLAPRRFIQQKGIISEISKFLKGYGEKPLFLADEVVASVVKDDFDKSLKKENLSLNLVLFKGECCQEEIERVTHITEKGKYDVLIGCGGGKAIDTAKAAAYYAGVPFLSFPTSAATCAAWSSACPIYSCKGEYIGTKELKRNPDLVLVDPEIIAQAPARLLSAGMGDSLAKWYEGRIASNKKNMWTEMALNLSSYLRNLIEKFGPQARADTEENICSVQVECIIQANILIAGLIGGLGGKNFRSAAAHAFNYALSGLQKASYALHGERVAIGILIQLALEGKKEEMIDLIRLYKMIGLPCRMEEIGVHLSREEIKQVSVKVCSDSRINNLPFSVDSAMFQEAFFEANYLAKKLTQKEKV